MPRIDLLVLDRSPSFEVEPSYFRSSGFRSVCLDRRDWVPLCIDCVTGDLIVDHCELGGWLCVPGVREISALLNFKGFFKERIFVRFSKNNRIVDYRGRCS